MPKKDDHLGKAEHDEQFISSFDLHTSPFVDWAITGLFYAALHYVEAFFATKGRHSADHRARNSSIQRDPDVKSLYDDYNELKNFSINARYYMTKFTEADFTKTLQPRFQKLKTHILSLI